MIFLSCANTTTNVDFLAIQTILTGSVTIMFFCNRSHQLAASMALLIGFVLVLVSGCGSGNVGLVEGVVTMDGTALEGAAVAFHPTEGRASIGRTDASGRYELGYIKNESGAVIGSHKVTVSTKIYDSEGMDSEGNPTMVNGNPETMPPRYSNVSKTVLTAEVKPGSNQVDFELTSQE